MGTIHQTMYSRLYGILLFLGVLIGSTHGAVVDWEASKLGHTAIVPMAAAPFPHESREEGFTNRSGKVFPKDVHYTDSSVCIFIPAGYTPKSDVHFVVYFHGHGNNVRKALSEFQLREQLVASGRQAVFLFPQGPKDAGDSGIGRMEEKDGLKNLLEETLKLLAHEGRVPPDAKPGDVVITGHSGAFRALSFCVEHGGLEDHIREVYLLDASYARMEQFEAWIARHPDRRFISIYTDHLQLRNTELMAALDGRGVSYKLAMEDAVDDVFLKENPVIFLHTKNLDHNQTVGMLERFLKSGGGASN